MATDATSPDFIIGVVGTGTMGRGIAQICAAGGYKVRLFDTRDGAAADAVAFVARMLNRAAEKGNMSADDASSAIAGLDIVGTLDDFAGAGLVIEAILEEIPVKRELFAALEKIVAADCILATNTSSLSVTAIAAGCERPGRVAGYHFFNPVPLMRVVEIIDGVLTEPWVGDVLDTVARRAGHTPVRAKDSPGFLVNHAGRGLNTEGLRVLAEGIADHVAIDDILRDGGARFRMGPFELMDTTGLDVSGPVMESIYHQFFEEPRFRPVAATRQRVAAGLFGRKSGRGYYEYEDNRKILPPLPPDPEARPERVWISPAEPEGQKALAALLDGHVEIDTGARPDARSICLLTPIGRDATTSALDQDVEPERTLAVDTLFGLDGVVTLMTTPVTDADLRDQVHGVLAAAGRSVRVIHDSPGFVAQRVVACIVNIGCDIAQQRIATPDDIDQAVRLGLGYPRGPIGFGDTVGPARILAILDALHDFYRDPRYRPSPWLVRRARLGVSLATPEG